MTFLKNVAIVSIVLAKCLVVVAIIGVAVSIMILPAIWIGEHVHWSLGLVYGVVSMVLIIAGGGTLLAKAKSETPVKDWLNKWPFDEETGS